LTDLRTMEVIAQLEEAFQDRPVWTRRSLLNHLGGKLRNWNELKKYLNYVAYQFKGGPWRDGVVPYGVDPRSDSKYRIYQTLMFKLPKQKRAQQGQSWRSLRKVQMGPAKEFTEELSESHMFDGETYHTDGKVWQVCDITDPLLKELFDNAAIRPSWDIGSGWYHGGLWAKTKAIMKTKLVAIQFGRRLSRTDFAPTLQAGDKTPIRTSSSATYHLPLPNLDLTREELTLLRGREPSRKAKNKGYSVRMRDVMKSGGRVAEEESVAPESQDVQKLLQGSDSDNADSGSGSDNDGDGDVDADEEEELDDAEDADDVEDGEDEVEDEEDGEEVGNTRVRFASEEA
jgi:general transcription factor 3C polypeptide 5 (transcription factor C subunit 1)